MADELIDVINTLGKPTGNVVLKSEAHKLGLYHASVHIWFYTKNKEILLQKRADNKDTFPGLWDVSVAGHVGAGESPENSAIREIEEEIGILISKNDLKFVGTYLSEKIPKPNLYDNELHYVYLSQLTTPVESLTLQKDEVSDVIMIDINAFISTLKDPIRSKEHVPHDEAYYTLILKEIQNKLH